MTGEVYEIRTVENFLQVPAERRNRCLDEFRLWLEMAQLARDMAEELGPVRFDHSVFKWINDDKGEAHLNIMLRLKGQGA